MGWMFGHYSKESLVKELTEDRENQKTVAKSLRGNVLYAIHEYRIDGEPQRVAYVYLLSKNDGEWGFKDMEETMGPYYYDAPLYFLDLLKDFPPMNDFSRQWREQVKIHHEMQRANRKKTQEVKKKLGKSKKFRKGGSQYLIWEWDGKSKLIAQKLSNGRLYRIPVAQFKSIEFDE